MTEETLYKFDELEGSQEKAREWYRGLIEADSIRSPSMRMRPQSAALMGLDIRTRPVKLMNGGTRYDSCIYWSGSSQGDGACFEDDGTQSQTRLRR